MESTAAIPRAKKTQKVLEEDAGTQSTSNPLHVLSQGPQLVGKATKKISGDY
jgi:hypothetical protein